MEIKKNNKKPVNLNPKEALALVLDCVDYTKGACTFTEMIGAVLSVEVIETARKALEEGE